jgi:hypothetical protein
MKITAVITSIAGIATMMLISGCATPVLTSTPTVTTNTVTGVATTNVVLTTNYVANSAAVQTGTTIQAAAPLIPAPFSPLVAILGMLVVGAASGVAGYKNAKASHETALQAVVTGVESAIGNQPALTTSIQQAISNASNSNGSTTTLQNSKVASNSILP